jgi:hypothetical protein
MEEVIEEDHRVVKENDNSRGIASLRLIKIAYFAETYEMTILLRV